MSNRRIVGALTFGEVAESLMMSVDQAGGRVLRMREPFTLVPSMRRLGREEARLRSRQISRDARGLIWTSRRSSSIPIRESSHQLTLGSRRYGAR
jgi:hypothetical protein